jgi:hypothetical protein
MRFPASLALIGLTGCALEPGDPWGRVALELRVVASLPEARRVDGRWLTARDYLVAIEQLEVQVDEVALLASSEAIAFSPDRPPKGYSLCHNGHCHAADGRLVPYDEIARELALDGAGALIDAAGGAVSLGLDATASIPLERCSSTEPCVIEAPVTLSTAVVSGVRVRVTGRVFDGRPTETARLPAEGLSFDLEARTVDLAARIHVAFGPDEGLDRPVALTLEPPDALFDDLDWAAITELAKAPDLLGSRLLGEGVLTAE